MQTELNTPMLHLGCLVSHHSLVLLLSDRQGAITDKPRQATVYTAAPNIDLIQAGKSAISNVAASGLDFTADSRTRKVSPGLASQTTIPQATPRKPSLGATAQPSEPFRQPLYPSGNIPVRYWRSFLP